MSLLLQTEQSKETMGLNSNSDFLFSNPNFWMGMGTAVNLAGNFYAFNVSPTSDIADLRAMKADFAAVGEDLLEAMRSYEQEVQQQEEVCGV